jgi:16S rRNA (adenine(1408)-N(1))-methyltransferase
LSNVLFVKAAVEALPSELDGIASEIHVNFPWGSLLHAVAAGDEAMLRGLRRLSAPHGSLSIVFGLDSERDRSEIERLELPVLDANYLERELPARYAKAGFEIVKTESLAGAGLAELQTSWAKRLQTGQNRSFVRITARSTTDIPVVPIQ